MDRNLLDDVAQFAYRHWKSKSTHQDASVGNFAPSVQWESVAIRSLEAEGYIVCPDSWMGADGSMNGVMCPDTRNIITVTPVEREGQIWLHDGHRFLST